tara:strand:+ start:394 stop:1266 length:873 start_codon:yes stop_codon:yes gene_type:complete
MITKKHIREIESLLNKGKIIKYNLLQVSFDIACLKIQISDSKKYIVKFYLNKKSFFNAITSEAKNLKYLNKKFDFFPKLIKFNNNYLIIQCFENDNYKPNITNSDFLRSIIKIHSISNNLYGFNFNTQIGALEQINDFENNWATFFINKRLNPIFEAANLENYMGSFVNKKINFLFKNINNFIPNNPRASLLHGDLWEGNILFKKNKFIGFIDPGSFFGHNEMEVAYLRWFNPSFIDSKFLEKYNDYIKLDKNYLTYEPAYQLYYALCNVALWDKSYIKETKKLLLKLKI